MYVKVTAGNGHGDTIFETSGPVQYDTIAAHFGANPIGETVGDVDYGAAIGVTFSRLSVLEMNPFPLTDYEGSQDIFSFRYAWWEDEKRGVVGVVTTRNIFIVGNDGKTIDRVH